MSPLLHPAAVVASYHRAAYPESAELEGSMRECSLAEIAENLPHWQQLALAHEAPEPFLQPYWFQSFWEGFAASRKATIVTARDRSGLAGILPLLRTQTFFRGIPARTLRSLSGAHSCRFDLTSRSEALGPVAKTIWHALRQDLSWDIIEALDVPADNSFGALQSLAQEDGFLAATWPTLQMPYLDLPPKNSDPFGNSPKRYRSFRRRLVTLQSRLADCGDLHFQVQPEFTNHAYSEFLALEASGWKSRTGGTIASRPEVQRFYERALTSAFRAGHLRLYSLRLRGRLIAMEIGLLLAGRYYAPKAAYDEGFAKYSPGHLLTRFVISDLVNGGVGRYDFLGPRARHKYVWTEQTRLHANRYIIRPTLRGHTARTLLSTFAPAFRRLKYACFGDPQA